MVDSKRCEIREEIDYCVRFADYDDDDEIKVKALVAKILGCLHSQGVVIKVERELPSGGEAVITLPRAKHLSYWRGYDQSHLDMSRAGYVATEPLIEEGKE